MCPIKIIFFDIDGTLIDMHTKQITPTTLQMLRDLQNNGIRICLATGRTPMTLPKFEGVEFDAYLTFNGSLCFHRDGVVLSNPLAAEDVRKLVENATRLGRPVSVATKDRLAANGVDRDLVDYYGIAKLQVRLADDFDQVCQQPVYQIMLGCREEEYALLLEGVSGAKIAAWWDRAADIIPSSGGKGTGVRAILKHFGIDREEAAAFGDGNNDIELLQAVGTAVAMENASDQLKAVADDVCGHVAHDGVYHYCRSRGWI